VPAAPATALDLASSVSKLSAPPIRPAVLKSVSSFSIPKNKSLLRLLSDEPLGQGGLSARSSPLGSFYFNIDMRGLRTEVVEGIEEIKDEIAQVDSQIASKAEQISPGECILVYRPSRTVKTFLVKAASRRIFTVFQYFHGPDDTPEAYKDFHNDLAKHGVEVIKMVASSSFLMSRLTRVVLDGQAVFANGDVMVPSYGANIATYAKTHRVPVTVLSGVYRFSSDLAKADDNVDTTAEEAHSALPRQGKGISVANALTDTIPGTLVHEFITNLYVPFRTWPCMR
jgi:translation initiation factor eIF-2B subunit beta